MKIIQPILITTLAIALILSITNSCHINESYNQNVALIKSLNSELIVYRDTLNREVAKRQVIETENVKQFLSIASKDTMILKLQDLVKSVKASIKNGGSAATISTETRIDTVLKTIVVYKGDTLHIVGLDSFIFPTYKFELDKFGGWVVGSGEASKDSTHISFNIKNDYSVVIGYERKNVFSKKIPYAVVTNDNPYTTTKDMRVYRIRNDIKSKRFGLGVQVGYGLTTDLRFKPYVGVGLSYQLINIF